MDCESKAVVSTSTNFKMSAFGREVEVDYPRAAQEGARPPAPCAAELFGEELVQVDGSPSSRRLMVWGPCEWIVGAEIGRSFWSGDSEQRRGGG